MSFNKLLTPRKASIDLSKNELLSPPKPRKSLLNASLRKIHQNLPTHAKMNFRKLSMNEVDTSVNFMNPHHSIFAISVKLANEKHSFKQIIRAAKPLRKTVNKFSNGKAELRKPVKIESKKPPAKDGLFFFKKEFRPAKQKDYSRSIYFGRRVASKTPGDGLVISGQKRRVKSIDGSLFNIQKKMIVRDILIPTSPSSPFSSSPKPTLKLMKRII